MWTRTTTALLEGLARSDNQAQWAEFDARFRPVLVGFARKLGLSPEDAADAAQETMARFLCAFRAGKYNRSRGRLSSWIIGIARHCILDIRQQRQARRDACGLSRAPDLPDDATLVDLFDREAQRCILAKALTALRERERIDAKTVEAFELIVGGNLQVAEVAETLGMTRNDVYLAKHRCLNRLRAIVDELRLQYELD